MSHSSNHAGENSSLGSSCNINRIKNKKNKTKIVKVKTNNSQTVTQANQMILLMKLKSLHYKPINTTEREAPVGLGKAISTFKAMGNL